MIHEYTKDIILGIIYGLFYYKRFLHIDYQIDVVGEDSA